MLGTVLANRYRLARIIGSGGMGDVYEAQRLSDGFRVAIKILREELVREHEAVTRFHREVRAAAALRSPYAARILDFGEGPNRQPYMVMEYLEGRDLMAEIEARGIIPVAEATGYLMMACEAMAEAHDLGIVHRDLKPPNLFLANDNGRRIVKVLDFGISKVNQLLDGHITSTKMSFGSPLYMSPEQIRSTKLVDGRSDVWSLGVIFYEAITGEPPFVADSPSGLAVVISVDAHVPPSLRRHGISKKADEIVALALQKDWAKRYQSVRALHTAFGELARELAVADPETAADSRRFTESRRTAEVSAASPGRMTLGPATTDPPETSPQNERLGRLAAAVLIPFGAVAFAFTIWLYMNRHPTEETKNSVATSSSASSDPARSMPSLPSAAPVAMSAPKAIVSAQPSASVAASVASSAATAKASGTSKPPKTTKTKVNGRRPLR